MSQRRLPSIPCTNNGQSMLYGWVDTPQNLYHQRIQPIPANLEGNRSFSPNQSSNNSQLNGCPIDLFQFKHKYPSQPGQLKNPLDGLQSTTAAFADDPDHQRVNQSINFSQNGPPIGFVPSVRYSSQPTQLPTYPYPIQAPYPSQMSYPAVRTPHITENSMQPQPSSYPYPESPHQSPQHCSYSQRSTNLPQSQPNYPENSEQLCYGSENSYKTAVCQESQAIATQPGNPWIQRKFNWGSPTLVPASDFDPVKDVHNLRRAMRGFGTDENALINIICRRSNAQRQQIQLKYKSHFGKDLIEDIKSDTNGNFQKVLVGLLLPTVDFYVKELSDAMAGMGTDEDVLVEVLCTLSNAEIQTIKRAYRKTHGWTLEAELKAETSGSFKRFLVSLCVGARDESGKVDPAAAFNDARDLLNAGEIRAGTDDSTFNQILCQRNFQQLKLIFQKYEHITGHSFDRAIKREFSGDIKDGLLAIYKCVTNKAEFFATRLHKSMAGLGTNNKQLIRIIITRSEIDMKDIKVAFEELYGKSLRNWIKDDITGNYKHAVYAVIGEGRSLK